MSSSLHKIGEQTFVTRTEAWECDFNGHWNTRFYGRAFACAAEVVAAMEDRDTERPSYWHLRFHRELTDATPVEVRSAVVRDGDYAGAAVHVLSGDGVLSATALSRPGIGAGSLPPVEAEALGMALPRGLSGEPSWTGAAGSGAKRVAEVGLLKSPALDEAGQLQLQDLVRLCGYASHDHIVDLGYSPAFTERTGVGRMLVELRAELFGPCRLGMPLQVVSQLVSVGGKSFITSHLIRGRAGIPAANVELCTVAVDMQSRRATDVPEFLSARRA